MAQPQKAGDRIVVTFSEEIFTVAAFFGESGIEYDTYLAAKKANPKGLICVKNKEHGGAILAKDCILIKK